MTGQRRHHSVACAAAIAAVAACAGGASAGILWNEPVDGDFSGNRLAPTALVLPAGPSDIFGRIEDGGGGAHLDLDFFSLTVPAGHEWSAMLLTTYLSPDTAAFMAIQPGPIFPNDIDTVSPDDLMGWAHFGPSALGLDLLTVMGNNTGRLTPPLPAGTYTLWVQQTDDLTEYALSMFVEPIPAPGTLAVVIPLLGWRTTSRRRGA